MQNNWHTVPRTMEGPSAVGTSDDSLIEDYLSVSASTGYQELKLFTPVLLSSPAIFAMLKNLRQILSTVWMPTMHL